MNIEHVNAVLVKAILGFQEEEIESMAEAMAVGLSSYEVPKPKGYAGAFKVPSPKDLEPKGGSSDIDERVRFTKALSKQLKRLKKDVKGIKSIRQGYKGTGGKRDQLQIFIDFKDWNRSIDLFISPGYVMLGGVQHTGKGNVDTSGRTAKDVYAEVLKFMKKHAEGGKG